MIKGQGQLSLPCFFEQWEAYFDEVYGVDDVSDAQSLPLEHCELPGKREVDEADHVEQCQTCLLSVGSREEIELALAHLQDDEIQVNCSWNVHMNLWLKREALGSLLIKVDKFSLLKVGFDPDLSHSVPESRAQLLLAKISRWIHGSNNIEAFLSHNFDSLGRAFLGQNEHPLLLEDRVEPLENRVICQ